MKVRIACLFVLIFGSMVSRAQLLPEKGMPLLRTYPPARYLNKGKVWDIQSAPNGLVYMAADQGLLEFDGKTWRCFQGSEGFTRSLKVVNDSLIYTGSDLDFGVWKRDHYQSFTYTSLYPFRKEVQEVYEEFWDVHLHKGNVLFVSAQNIYLYKNGQLTKITAPWLFSGSFAVGESLYFADVQQGLFLFDNYTLKKLLAWPENEKITITGMYRSKDEMVIVTQNSGLYRLADSILSPLDNALSDALKSSRVFSFSMLDHAHIAFGTVLSGLFVADLQGNLLHRVNKYKGLLSNTILSMHYDPSGRLWMGTDFGIASLAMKNPVTYFYDSRGDFGTGYAALVVGDDFYLGTNQGLFKARWSDLNNSMEFTRFTLVPGTVGQVWSLKFFENKVYIAHNEGLLMLENDEVKKVGDQYGVWTIMPFKDYLLTGTYNGISIYRRTENGWTFERKMELISGSCWQLINEKEQILWVNIPNYGIIRAELDSKLYPVKRSIFLEKKFRGAGTSLLRDQKGIHVITDTRQYFFQEKTGKFVPEAPSLMVRNIENLLAAFYQPPAFHPNYDFYPVHNGFALKYRQDPDEKHRIRHSLLFRKAEAYHNRSRITIHENGRIPYKFNNVVIEFIVPHGDDALYQHRLSEDEEWSSLISENRAELVGLRHGSYTLEVRSVLNGKIIAQNSFSFRISSPWYLTWIAYLAYVIVFGILIFLFYRWQSVLLKKQKKRMLLKEQNSLRQQAEKHREKIMRLEQERLKTEYDLLKQQLRHKTIELANKSKDNEDKNRLLVTLKEKFDTLQREPLTTKIRLSEIRRILDSYLKVDDKTFEIQMDELHQELFKKLKEQFPTLSTNDLRLCAYLKVGLNSREIADILNIQPSSSYISRSRLRKKLNLKPEEDLYDFLNAL